MTVGADIGGHLAEQFLREGHEVVVLDSLNPYYNLGIKKRTIERCRKLASTSSCYEFVKEDIRDAKLVSELVEDVDYVCLTTELKAALRERDSSTE